MVNDIKRGGNSSGDKAGLSHWDYTYQGWDSGVFEPHSEGIRFLGRRKWHSLFTKAFHSYVPHGGRLIEVGCGGSKYLPYFAREFELSVSGIDYSEHGCYLAEKNLKLANVNGNVLYGDLFHPPQELIGASDIAVSFGLVEHFSDAENPIAHIVQLLRPGGLTIKTVPNMSGFTGLAQKYLARDIYDKHIALSRDDLATAHTISGLMILESGYLEFMNFGVVNIGDTGLTGLSRSLRNIFHKGLHGITMGAWILETIFGLFAGNSLTSPYVYCIARKPG